MMDGGLARAAAWIGVCPGMVGTPVMVACTRTRTGGQVATHAVPPDLHVHGPDDMGSVSSVEGENGQQDDTPRNEDHDDEGDDSSESTKIIEYLITICNAELNLAPSVNTSNNLLGTPIHAAALASPPSIILVDEERPERGKRVVASQMNGSAVNEIRDIGTGASFEK